MVTRSARTAGRPWWVVPSVVGDGYGKSLVLLYWSSWHKLANRFAEELAGRLGDELEILSPAHAIYVARGRIDPGQRLEQTIAGALCRSYCMIVTAGNGRNTA